jgi:hypothetical protein
MIYRRGVKRIVILKARQLRFSTLLGVSCADQLCWHTGKQISLVDKAQEDARQKLKNITVWAYDSFHPELKKALPGESRQLGRIWCPVLRIRRGADLHHLAGESAKGGA